MARRLLQCLDAVPAEDGSCAQTAWVEQAELFDAFPTPEQAQDVGIAFFTSIVLVGAMSLFLPTREERD